MRAIHLSLLSIALLATACRDAPIPGKPPARLKRIDATKVWFPSRAEEMLAATEPMRVGDGVTAPVAIHRVAPNYAGCRQLGFVLLEAVITKDGDVRSIRAMKSPNACVTAEMTRALSQWKFKPGTLNGQPVDVIFNLTVMPHYR